MNIIRWVSVVVLAILLGFVIWRGTNESQGYKEKIQENELEDLPLEDRVTYPLELAPSEWKELAESYQFFHDQGVLTDDTWVRRAANQQLSLTDVIVIQQEVLLGMQKYIQGLQEKNMKHTDQIHSLRMDLTQFQEKVNELHNSAPKPKPEPEPEDKKEKEE